MKEALVLETYDEVKNAMMSGKDINFEMVIDAKVEKVIPAKEEFNIGDPFFMDGELVGVVAAVDTYVNGSKKTLVLAANKEKEEMTWNEAMALYKGDVHGWRLPTKEEGCLIFANLDEIKSAYKKLGLEEPCGWNWSSSEYSSNGAWRLYFSNGGVNYSNKDNNRYVRPVLAF